MAAGPIAERNQDATVYVGGLDDKVTESILWELFLQAGPVVNVHMPKDRVTQNHQGYGFIEFMGEDDADYAIKIMNMIKLYGKPIRVNKASAHQKNLDIGANIFIGNLDPEVDEKLLYDTFSAFGVILQTPKIMRDTETGNSKGFAFINYASFEASDAAIEAMNGQYLCNRSITISYAFKKEAKGERHGSAAERLLAAQNPLSLTDRPHQLFADAPPPPQQPPSGMAPPPPPPSGQMPPTSGAGGPPGAPLPGLPAGALPPPPVPPNMPMPPGPPNVGGPPRMPFPMPPGMPPHGQSGGSFMPPPMPRPQMPPGGPGQDNQQQPPPPPQQMNMPPNQQGFQPPGSLPPPPRPPLGSFPSMQGNMPSGPQGSGAGGPPMPPGPAPPGMPPMPPPGMRPPPGWRGPPPPPPPPNMGGPNMGGPNMGGPRGPPFGPGGRPPMPPGMRGPPPLPPRGMRPPLMRGGPPGLPHSGMRQGGPGPMHNSDWD